jgi:hypothetical protein
MEIYFVSTDNQLKIVNKPFSIPVVKIFVIVVRITEPVTNRNRVLPEAECVFYFN